MAAALQRTRRPIVLSVSEWGFNRPWLWAPSRAHMWRTARDIRPAWATMMRVVDANARLAPYAHPGAWNDPDVLQVGTRHPSGPGSETWIRPLANGDRAIVLLNRSSTPRRLGADARDLGLPPAASYLVRNLWSQRTTTSPGPITAVLPRHASAMFRVASARG